MVHKFLVNINCNILITIFLYQLCFFRLNQFIDYKSLVLFGGLTFRHFSRGKNPWLFNFYPSGV